MLSIWEQRSFATWDVVVVGAGIVGLSTALAVRRARPKASILVLERGVLPTGASSRNAGFACFGSLSEVLADVQAHGATAAAALVGRRHVGLRHLLERLGVDGTGYRPCGGWELLRPGQEGVLDQLDTLDAALRPLLGGPVFRRDDARLAAFGFGGVRHLVHLPHEGSIDTGRTLRTLLDHVRAAGIDVWTGAEVTRLVPGASHVDVVLEPLSLWAGQVAVCTNGFAQRLLPDSGVRPGRGQVLVTAPVADLPFQGVFHLDHGFVYFRDLDGRVLLGGGRNLDVEGETTTELGLHEGIQRWLDTQLAEVVLPGRSVRVTHRWSGIMGFGPTRGPVVQSVGPRVACGVGLGGMGVALGTQVGDEVAALLASSL